MFKTVIAATLLASATGAEVHPRERFEAAFYEYSQKFELEWKSGAHYLERLEVFINKVQEIEAHNADPTNTYTKGLNQFSWMTEVEWRDYMKFVTKPPRKNLRSAPAPVHAAPKNLMGVPASVDWEAAGAVTPVKNQGSCGSCWSFSTTGALEGAYEIKYSNLQSFSEQQLVSCDTTDQGCNGGWMDDAFTWVTNNKGITTEAAYPYTSGSGATGTCKSTGYTNNANAAPVGFTDVEAGSVDALMSAVAQQPVSIAIQANQASFQSYSGGVLTGKCGQQLDHGVLAVGYGTLNGVDYWKVKNSWGASWGMAGYILIERSSKDLCGVLDAASYPNL